MFDREHGPAFPPKVGPRWKVRSWVQAKLSCQVIVRFIYLRLGSSGGRPSLRVECETGLDGLNGALDEGAHVLGSRSMVASWTIDEIYDGPWSEIKRHIARCAKS